MDKHPQTETITIFTSLSVSLKQSQNSPEDASEEGSKKMCPFPDGCPRLFFWKRRIFVRHWRRQNVAIYHWIPPKKKILSLRACRSNGNNQLFGSNCHVRKWVWAQTAMSANGYVRKWLVKRITSCAKYSERKRLSIVDERKWLCANVSVFNCLSAQMAAREYL